MKLPPGYWDNCARWSLIFDDNTNDDTFEDPDIFNYDDSHECNEIFFAEDRPTMILDAKYSAVTPEEVASVS
jgi:hypothetical protein